jgi:hypothetical protein
MQHYQYSDGTIGPARQVSHNGQIFPSHYLSLRSAETEAEWIARIAVIGVTPVTYEAWPGDINSQYKGEPEETMTDGWLVISYPVLDKTPVWSTAKRERMYILPGAAVPDGYTAQEPVDGVYSTWTGEAWEYNTDLRAEHERTDRDQRLADCDGIVLQLERQIRLAQASGGDTTALEEGLAAWDAYREELCDVPAQAGFPTTVTWPEAPEA